MWYRDMRYPQVFPRLTVGQRDPRGLRRHNNKNSLIKNRNEKSAAPPIKTGSHILQEIDNLGVGRVIDIDVVEVNNVICKTCGWNKRSIFLELLYWSSNLIRHNLGVMNIEKNVFNTVLDIEGKTKDNEKARVWKPW